MRHTDDLSPSPIPRPDDARDVAAQSPALTTGGELNGESAGSRPATPAGETPTDGPAGAVSAEAGGHDNGAWGVTWDPEQREGEWSRTQPLPRLAVALPEADAAQPEAEPEPEVAPAGAAPPRSRQPWGLYGLIGLVVVLAGAFFGFQVAYAGRVYPGVSMLGVPLGGMTRAEAADALRQRVRSLEDREITLRDGDRAWALGARDLGLQLDADHLAVRSLLYGRDGPIPLRLAQQAQGVLGGLAPLDPQASTDQRVLDIQLDRLAGQIDQPPLDATLTIRGAGTVEGAAAQIGRTLDHPASGERIKDALADERRATVSLIVQEQQPKVVDADVAAARASAARVLSGPFALRAGDKTWEIPPAEIAQMLSVEQQPGKPATLLVDESPLRKQIREAAGSINQDVQDAKLELKQDLTLDLTPARPGREVDVDASTRNAWNALVAGQRGVDLVVKDIPPTTTDAMRRPAYEAATKMLSGPLAVELGDQRWALGKDDIAKLIQFHGGMGETMTADLDEDGLRAWLQGIADEVKRDPQDARFAWKDGTLSLLRPSAEGRQVDVDAAMKSVREHLTSSERTVPLTAQVLKPTVTTDQLSSLMFAEKIDESATSFTGAVPEKAHNITLAAERLNGVVVMPGQTFSFNKEVGPTTLDTGFQWGFGLEAGNGGVKTIPSVAGGICQVATTLFQPVFWSGYRVEERHWHLYWIPAYTSRGVVGLDATVDEDSNLDFQFTNTTQDPLLIQSWVEGENVHFALYGKKPSWTVKVDGPTITNVVKPDETPITQQDSTLPAGQKILVQTAREGFDSLLVRTVTDGTDQRVLNLKSSYQPGRNITLVGTGGAAPQTGTPAMNPALDPNRPAGGDSQHEQSNQ